ncbi:MAG: hypothetical protein KG029_20265 [Bacteroidetes bacterium]|jgi:hypothetical protein|nr:hypothetical protein [Bacteroidota bacterium]
MKRIIFIWFFIISVFGSYGQSKSDTIEIKKTLGTVFQQQGKNLTPRQLLEITQSNAEAYKAMKTAKSNYDISSVFGFAGGFLVGWPLGTAIGGGKPNWTLAGIGAGLIAVSIPFTVAYTKHAKTAVNLHNNGLRSTGLSNAGLKLGLTSNGVGVTVKF